VHRKLKEGKLNDFKKPVVSVCTKFFRLISLAHPHLLIRSDP